MSDSSWFYVIHVPIFMLLFLNQRSVAQPSAPETSVAKPTELSLTLTTNAPEEPVRVETDTQASDEFSTLLPDSSPTAIPELSSTPTTDAEANLNATPTDATTDVNSSTTEVTTVTSTVTIDAGTSVCFCDLTPDLCDIACCCDSVDCGTSNLGSVFSGCEIEERSGICIEKWLMFRANVDPALITVSDSYFCVGNEDQRKNYRALPAVLPIPRLQNILSFLQQASTFPGNTNTAFYKVDDAILTYFKSTSVLSVLRQPSPAAASSDCVDRNPARFLRSSSLSCSRSVTALYCLTHPGLNANSYISDISLLKTPIPQDVSIPDLMIPVLPLSERPNPSLKDDSCLNVASQVEYTVEYTSSGEITSATVDVTLMNCSLNSVLLQHHAIHYQLASPSPTPGPSPPVGLPFGAPVIGQFGDDIYSVTVQGTPSTGECSSLPNERTPVLLAQNYFTGCSFSSPLDNCSELQSELFGILQGAAVPELVAMNSGTNPDWTRVIVQNCSEALPDALPESSCLVPQSLSIQLLWAQRGLLSLPQNHILGAKFIFRCQVVKCPLTPPLTVTTEVTFSDSTVYPEPPRSKPQPRWKFPFGFFSRGEDEQDAGADGL
ncbi:hypothetical protein GJAV_G00261360 [Gymnothorax javanicus]|nr:hypothetical protein GJAV_G00261360 [Gymnothorax javanicus]